MNIVKWVAIGIAGFSCTALLARAVLMVLGMIPPPYGGPPGAIAFGTLVFDCIMPIFILPVLYGGIAYGVGFGVVKLIRKLR